MCISKLLSTTSSVTFASVVHINPATKKENKQTNQKDDKPAAGRQLVSLWYMTSKLAG